MDRQVQLQMGMPQAGAIVVWRNMETTKAKTINILWTEINKFSF